MAASGEATVTHSRSLEDTAMLSVWINTGNERRAELGRDRPDVAFVPSRLTFRCHAVDSPLPWRKVAQVAKSAIWLLPYEPYKDSE